MSASPTPPGGPDVAGYPAARRADVVDDLHGQQVPDPYRWLEDAAGGETREWLQAQDALWASAEAGLPGRSRLAARIQELMAAGYVSAPVWRGPRQFFMRRLPGQEHGVLLTAAPGEPERVLIDPAALDPAGLTTLDSWQPDKEGRLLAYQLSSGGDEESELRVLDVVSGEQVDGPVSRCRYSPVAWLPGGKGFYYVRKLPPDQVPPGEEQFHRRVYLHTVSTPAEEDLLVFGEGRDKTDYYSVSVSRDGRWLVIGAAQGTAPRNDVWLADLTASGPAEPLLQVVQEGVDARTGLHVGRDGRLYVFTDAGAPRGRLAVADPASVPAGKYAKASLEKLGVWDSVKDKLAQAENVRAALAFIAQGEAPLGIVYETDALVDKGVRVVDTFPDSSHLPIIYPVAATTSAQPAAAQFLKYLQSEAALATFRKFGFSIRP